jgi:hypothetical protein
MRVVLEDVFAISRRGVFGILRHSGHGLHSGQILMMDGLRVIVEDIAPRLLRSDGGNRTDAIVVRFEGHDRDELERLKGTAIELSGQ